MMKLNEVVKVNEGPPLMGNAGKKLVADWLELSEQMRNLFVGAGESRTPDAFGQGGNSQDQKEFVKAIEHLDNAMEEIEKKTGIQSAVPKDIQY